MGHFRFRKSIGSKFLKLNISKTGFSVTGGLPGAHFNADLSNRRKRMFMNTFSLPGSGLSYRTDPYGPERVGQQRSQLSPQVQGGAFVIGLITLIIAYCLWGF